MRRGTYEALKDLILFFLDLNIFWLLRKGEKKHINI